jgi:hypothetical protein
MQTTKNIGENTMKKFTVYHTRNWGLNTKLHFFDPEDPASTKELCPEFSDGYVPVKENYKEVAQVLSESLGDVFRITNHINVAWWENPEVLWHEESRSTSVGDLVEDEDGQLWLCCGVGWSKVEWSKALATHMIKSDNFGEYLIPLNTDKPTVIG